MASPFAQLPGAIRAHLGALAEDWPDEERSTCGACPLVIEGEAGVAYPFSMAREARCCTAQPNLANFLVGRTGDAVVVRARLDNRDGISAWGIRAVAGYDAEFPTRAKHGFGRDVGMRCPFWVGGDHACGVWLGRSARCRAFFCRHDRGLAGALSWSQAAGLGVAIEAAIATHFVATLGGAPADDARPTPCSRGTRGARPRRTSSVKPTRSRSCGPYRRRIQRRRRTGSSSLRAAS